MWLFVEKDPKTCEKNKNQIINIQLKRNILRNEREGKKKKTQALQNAKNRIKVPAVMNS